MSMKEINGWNPDNIHFSWKPGREPIETIKNGDRVRVRIPDSSTMQIKEDWTTEDMGKLDFGKLDGAVGPIYIEDAQPGDALEIEFLGINTGKWGWSSLQPDFGFIRKRFQNRLIHWDIKEGYAETRGNFLKGIRIDTSPFLGVVGVSPSKGEYGMIPPQSFGGNMDNHLLVKGSRLQLPVQVTGAHLSLADPHASQGDGEVCGTAIETSADVTIKVSVLKGLSLEMPRAFSPYTDRESKMVCMGISDDLKEATAKALENMIGALEHIGFTDEEAYALLSVAGDLRISEIVDEPNYVVSATIAEKYTRR